jgi:hypothetical protein
MRVLAGSGSRHRRGGVCPSMEKQGGSWLSWQGCQRCAVHEPRAVVSASDPLAFANWLKNRSVWQEPEARSLPASTPNAPPVYPRRSCGKTQAAQREEQQRLHQLAKALRGTGEQRSRSCRLTRSDCCLQTGEQTRLPSQLPAGTALRLLPECWLPLLADFFSAWLAALLHPCAARTALR